MSPGEKMRNEGMVQRAARTALGASTKRIGKGIGAATQGFLCGVNLRRFAACRSEAAFLSELDAATVALHKALPAAGSWGVARKALNIFLYGVVINHHLRTAHGLERIEPWLEVPLDSLVGKALHERFPEDVPRWRTIRGLTPEASRAYQQAAKKYAAEAGVPDRVNIDDQIWAMRKRVARS